MSPVEVVVLLSTFVVVLAVAARRLTTPLPLVLALGGAVFGALTNFLPGLPARVLPPDLVLPVFLPPLLLAAAYRVPLGAFRARLRPITLLAVGLVLATMAAVAVVAHALLPGVGWPAAFVLGAVVAPPDPVAATQVGRRLGLESRLVTILEGEGMVNDATALGAYQIAVAAAVTGSFSWTHALLEVAVSAPFGVLVGLAVGWVTAAVRRRLDEAVLETAVSLLVPYVAWLVAERVGTSAVLAVVTLGFYLRLRAGEIGGPATRLTSRVVWSTADFAASGMVFALVGLELGRVAAAGVPRDVLADAAVVAVAVVALRLAWMYTVPLLARVFVGRARAAYSFRELTVLGWAGMRGVVSLALALVIPYRTAAGEPFPARTALVVISMAVVFATLIGQGLTLSPLIRRLGIGNAGAGERQERAARKLALRAARACLAQQAGALPRAELERITGDLVRYVGVGRDPRTGEGPPHAGAVDALRAALGAERSVVLRLREDGRLDDELAARLEAEIDVDEMALSGSSAEMLGKSA
jgi:monovalent cation/hydrogen antiporter